MKLNNSSFKFHFVFFFYFQNTRVMPLRCTYPLGILRFVRVWEFLPFHWRQFTWCIVDSKVRWIKRRRKEVRGWEAEANGIRGGGERESDPLGNFQAKRKTRKRAPSTDGGKSNLLMIMRKSRGKVELFIRKSDDWLGLTSLNLPETKKKKGT